MNQQSEVQTPEAPQGAASLKQELDDRLFHLFIGERVGSGALYKLYNKHKQSKPAFLSFNWLVFLSPYIWLFYRKFYVLGGIAVILPILLIYFIPGLQGMSMLAITGALAVMVNKLYVDYVLLQIGKLKSTGMSQAELEKTAQANGGTDMFGAILGVAILLGQVGAVILAG